jgi:hypothetical protein
VTRRRLVAAAAAVGVALAVSACGGGHPTPAARLRAWESGASYGSDQGYISSDIREIASGMRSGPLEALHTACDGLGVDAANAYGELPTPDQTLTDDLNDEYLAATNAAQSCSTASRLHGRRVERYLALIAGAERDRSAAQARIAQILSS